MACEFESHLSHQEYDATLAQWESRELIIPWHLDRNQGVAPFKNLVESKSHIVNVVHQGGLVFYAVINS